MTAESEDIEAGPSRHLLSPLAEFLHTEAAGGIALLVAASAALVWANSQWGDVYDEFWHYSLKVGLGDFAITEDLQHWVNDGLMAMFFFLIGLEIKRELVDGELRDPRAAALPALAAVGGMVAPALIYVAVAGGGEAGRGWGIPMATDIAFVVGVLALLGNRAPSGLKLFLLTLAIVDDLGAIGVIAVFYSEGVDGRWLVGAGLALLGVVLLQRLGIAKPLAYVPLAIVVWVCTFESGVHATIAGVALGFLTPTGAFRGRHVLEELEGRLHPWSTFLVVPLFALANSGIDLTRDSLRAALDGRVAWAVLAGLVLGKTIGIAGVTSLALRLRIGRLPTGMRPGHLVGAGALAGIGFTVSLFVTALAFESDDITEQAKLGILVASAIASAIGALLIGRPEPEPRPATEPELRQA